MARNILTIPMNQTKKTKEFLAFRYSEIPAVNIITKGNILPNPTSSGFISPRVIERRSQPGSLVLLC